MRRFVLSLKVVNKLQFSAVKPFLWSYFKNLTVYLRKQFNGRLILNEVKYQSKYDTRKQFGVKFFWKKFWHSFMSRRRSFLLRQLNNQKLVFNSSSFSNSCCWHFSNVFIIAFLLSGGEKSWIWNKKQYWQSFDLNFWHLVICWASKYPNITDIMLNYFLLS